MKKTTVLIFVFITAVLLSFACRADGAYISNQNGETERASLNDVLSVNTDEDMTGGYITWYADGAALPDTADTLKVTAEMLGKTITASVTVNGTSVTTAPVKIAAGAPALEFSGNPGDYSAYLTWSGKGNGSDITKYEISYALSASPDVTVKTITIDPESSGYTLTGLSGGSEHIIKLTAYNEAGSTSVTIRLTPNDPDLATAVAVKNEIESLNFAIHMDLGNDPESIRNYLLSYFGRYSDYGVTVKDVIVDNVVPAVRKSALLPDAPAGSFSYVAEIGKGDVSLTTKYLTAQIDNSSSIVFLTAEKFSVLRGEKLTVTASLIDINLTDFEWFVASSSSDEGVRIESSKTDRCEIPTDKAGEFFVYCICGGVSSSRLRIVVNEPFVPVSDVELSTETLTAGQSGILHADIYPSNATNTSIVWSILNDGGCMAVLNGRTVTAYEPGTVTLKATVKNGVAEGDYEKTFYITVRRRPDEQGEQTDEADAKTPISELELDCSAIAGIEALTVKYEGGDVQITPVSDETIRKILESADVDADIKDMIGAVKFVYDAGSIAHETSMKIKGYDGRVTVLTVNGNGGKTVTEQTPENGIVYGNAVSPDTVILLKEKKQNGNGAALALLLLPAAPVAFAAVFITVITVVSKKSKMNKNGR